MYVKNILLKVPCKKLFIEKLLLVEKQEGLHVLNGKNICIMKLKYKVNCRSDQKNVINQLLIPMFLNRWDAWSVYEVRQNKNTCS